ncbi:hypothetical protein [uncultured Thiodictyon sp.]|uniref:hypothetical protein n=1 Tax=uncultured Thiodictyon sp. TaxID=1846217 RepID=UPI0025E9EC03|nr:hypothetical protein [uncultured Thiodictyon sp.]
MIRRRVPQQGSSKARNHGFRTTGITDYFKTCETLEKAAAMANQTREPPAVGELFCRALSKIQGGR